MAKVITILFCVLNLSLYAQFGFQTVQSIDVLKNSELLPHAWSGGMDNAQFSNIDLNNDGIQDLFIFDKSTNKVLTFIQNGTTGNVDFQYAPQYESNFPELKNWCLLVDYNCDGKEDIFTSTIGGIKVYKNVSTANSLLFELEKSILKTNIYNNDVFMYASSVDVPGIVDVDFDGDIDILAFGVNGVSVEYQRNMSVETYGHCDSLIFETGNVCWGLFKESSTTNTILLNETCSNQVDNPYQYRPTENQDRHAGSTLLPLDYDGDGVMDLILGDISYNTLTMLINGGAAPNQNSAMVSQDNAFPSNSTSVDLPIFPAAYYVDVNNDNIRDMIVSPNSTIGFENRVGTWYYKNTGTDANPTFQFQQNDFLQSKMIDIGSGSYPVFFDHNADGLVDLLVSSQGQYDPVSGNQKTRIYYYQNTGTATVPEFTFVTDDYQNLSLLGIGTELNFYPTFADLDGDGDKDMVLGEYTGYCYYFENTGGAGNTAIFNSFVILETNDGTQLNEGVYPIPQLVDVDRDGDFDLILGKRNGTLSYYKNIGSTSNYEFKLFTSNFGDVDVTEPGFVEGRAVPVFVDNNGAYELVVGSKTGYLHHYNQIEDNLEGSFNLVSHTLDNINVGNQSAPAIFDLNQNDYYKMILGNKRGGLSLFDSAPISQISIQENIDYSVKVYPTLTNKSIVIELNNVDLKGNEIVSIIDLSGKIHYQINLENNKQAINVADFENGLYIVQVTIQNKSYFNKIIIQHD